MCLVKPQFECGPDIVRKGRGVVRDPADRQSADSIIAFATSCRIVQSSTTPLSRQCTISSAIENFYCGLRRRNTGQVASLEAAIAKPSAMPGVAAALAAAAPGIAAAADGGNQDQARSSPTAGFCALGHAGIKGVADKLRRAERVMCS